MLFDADPPAKVWSRVRSVIRSDLGAEAILAHNADFDRRFIPEDIYKGTDAISLPWVCTMDGLKWPGAPKPAGMALQALVLHYGMGIASAHRASADVDMIARLLTRMAEKGIDLEAFVAVGLRPMGVYLVADTSFDEQRNELVKEWGFKWNLDHAPKRWSRKMAHDDVGGLPFSVVEARR